MHKVLVNVPYRDHIFNLQGVQKDTDSGSKLTFLTLTQVEPENHSSYRDAILQFDFFGL